MTRDELDEGLRLRANYRARLKDKEPMERAELAFLAMVLPMIDERIRKAMSQ